MKDPFSIRWSTDCWDTCSQHSRHTMSVQWTWFGLWNRRLPIHILNLSWLNAWLHPNLTPFLMAMKPLGYYGDWLVSWYLLFCVISKFSLPEDNLLPGFRFKVPMMFVLGTLRSDNPTLRRLGETWMRCSLKSYIRYALSIVYLIDDWYQAASLILFFMIY